MQRHGARVGSTIHRSRAHYFQGNGKHAGYTVERGTGACYSKRSTVATHLLPHIALQDGSSNRGVPLGGCAVIRGLGSRHRTRSLVHEHHRGAVPAPDTPGSAAASLLGGRKGEGTGANVQFSERR